MAGPLDDLLPIRRLLVDGSAQPFVRDLEFDGDDFQIDLDANAGVQTVRIAHGGTVVAPSGDATGVTDRTATQAALDADEELVLVAGATYVLDRALVVPSGARIRTTVPGGEPWVLTRGSSWSPSGADSTSNALIRIVGATTGLLSTTLSAEVDPNARGNSIPLTSTTGLDAAWASGGGCIRVSGNNPALGTDASDMSDGSSVILTELFEAAGAAAGGAVAAKAPPRVYHTAGKAAVTYAPVRDVEISGGKLDGGAAATTACGIYAEGALRLRIRDMVVAHFSRAAIECGGGCKDVQIDRVHSLGRVNAILFFVSSHDIEWSRITSDPNGTRSHEAGYPKPLISHRWRCSHVVGRDSILGGGVGGLRIWGGTHIKVCDVVIRDCYFPSAQRGRTTGTVDESPAAGRYGSGVDGGASRLDIAEFAQGIEFSNVTTIDCWLDAEADNTAAWYVHDWYDFRADRVSAVFLSQNYHSTGEIRWPTGFTFSDCRVQIGSLFTRGCQYAINEENGFALGSIESVVINCKAGDTSANNNGLISLDTSQGTDSGIKYGRIEKRSPADAGILFFPVRSLWAAAPDLNKVVREFRNDSNGIWTNVVMARYVAASPSINSGDILALDRSYTGIERRVIVPAATADLYRCVIVAAGYPGASCWMAVAIPGAGQNTVVVDTGFALGDLVKADPTYTTRRVVVDNAPANVLHVIGRMLSYSGIAARAVLGPVH